MTLWQVHHFRASERLLYTCGGIYPYDLDVGGLITPALDYSGQFVVVASYYYAPRMSLNSGVDWSVVDPWPGYAGFRALDCNTDGTHIIACEYPGRLQVSWDQGATWPYGLQGSNRYWSNARMSLNGDVCLAFDEYSLYYNGGRFYISTDGGSTWITSSIGTTSPNTDVDPRLYYGMSCSATGAKVAVIKEGVYYYEGGIPKKEKNILWLSNSYGANFSWTKTLPNGAIHGANWVDVDMDSDGSVIVICEGTSYYSYADAGSIWVSKDGGGTWAQKYPLNDGLGHSWQTVSCSDDGSVILAKKRNNQYYDSLWYSWNTGTDWREVKPAGDVNIYWGKPIVSGSGSILSIVNPSTPYDMYICQLATL
jgi:hypothetical protein